MNEPEVPTMDEGRLKNILDLLKVVDEMEVPGVIAEFGVYTGRTLLAMIEQSGRSAYAFDSFEGLPAPDYMVDKQTTPFKKGFLACDEESVKQRIEDAGYTVTTVPGYFENLTPDQIPSRIAFAHLDGDFYSSIKASLELVYPNLSPGAVVVIDDYGWEELAGVQKAVDEFLADKPEKAIPLPTGSRFAHAFFLKEGDI